jgi:acetyl esterase/lipase
MNYLRIIIFVILATSANFAFSQEKTLNVWESKIPGSIENPNYTCITDSNDNWVKTRMVSNPTLDFYPANKNENTGTAVIICPGGAYWGLAIEHEGWQVAEWFNSIGISAFVLKYRLPNDAIMTDKTIGPLQDAQEAIRLIRRNAKNLNIDTQKIGIMGFSAGGHLAASLSTLYNDEVYVPTDTTGARPNFSLLIYPVITMQTEFTHMGSRNNLLGENPSQDLLNHFSNELQVDSLTPPAFLVHSIDDGAVPVQNSINYALALKKFNIPCELHIYQTGGHGYGMGRSNNTESSWTEACKKWLMARGLL